MLARPVCRSCGAPIERRGNEGLERYRARTICSIRNCTGANAIAPQEYPYAHVQRWEDLPPRCGHCGGPFTLREAGVVCLTCGRERIVAEAIRAAEAGRPVTRIRRIGGV